MAPLVTGDVNVDALENLVRLCVELDARRRDGARDAAWAALEQAVIGKAVDLLSGPGGLAWFLRRRQLAAAGRAEPAAGHRVFRVDPGGHPQRGDPAGPQVRWAGGCNQPASACEVHHTKHKEPAARPAPRTVFCCARSTTRSSSTGGAGPWS